MRLLGWIRKCIVSCLKICHFNSNTCGSVIINKVSTTRDGALKIEIITRELPAEEKLKILDASYKEEVSLGIGKIEEDNGKSPSVRMRGVIYRIFENTDKSKTFEQFYREYMEKIIDMLKEKI